jgi:tetratricopeptide (TPR) repeat protein
MLKWVNGFTNYTVLSKGSIDKMFSPLVQEEGYNGESYFGYGCNISKSRRNTTMISNGGSNGIYFARIIRLPEEGIVFYMVTNESSASTNLVLPNVTQLYFTGKIEQDAFQIKPKFENPLAEQVYNLLEKPGTTDLEKELEKANLLIDDDMILLEAGQKLTGENKLDKALVLYKYYTEKFPQIVVAWNDLGDIYLAKNNKVAAKNCYTQALKIRPGNPRATENLKKLE